MNEVFSFLIESLKSIGLAILFLITGLLFLPDRIILFILQTIKPNLTKSIKQPLKDHIKTLVNLYMKNEVIEINPEASDFSQKTSYYIAQNDNIDKNIYVIKLCKDLIGTLQFVFPSLPQKSNFSIYEQAMSYLYHYSHLVVSLDQDKNFDINFLDRIHELEVMYSESSEYQSPNDLDIIMVSNKQFVKNIMSYLAEENRKLENLKNSNKKKLIQLLQKSTGEL